MKTPCSICVSEHRVEIDKALLRGASQRSTAKQFGVGASAVNRHVNKGHIPKAMEKARTRVEVKAGDQIVEVIKSDAVAELQTADSLIAILDETIGTYKAIAAYHLKHIELDAQEADALATETMMPDKLREIQERRAALHNDSSRVGIQATRELNRSIELMLKARGDLVDRTEVIHTSPQWKRLKEILLTALKPYPDALRAVVAALQREKDV